MEEDRQEVQVRLSPLENILILLEEVMVNLRNMARPEGETV
jgi:hypothetical protein